MLLVLFLAYAAQVRFRPYMSPEEREEVVREHSFKAQHDSLHARLAVMVKAAEAHGKKSTHRAVPVGPKRSGAITAAAVWGYLFNYNTVEMVLLFCCCLVALCGIMFESGQLSDSAFSSQRAAVAAFVIVVIVASIVYCTASRCAPPCRSSYHVAVCLAVAIVVFAEVYVVSRSRATTPPKVKSSGGSPMPRATAVSGLHPPPDAMLMHTEVSCTPRGCVHT